MSTAFVCPGQGSQTVGMGADLIDRFPVARSLYKEADEVLDWSVTDVSINGPAEKLKDTRFTQPALYVHSVAAGTVLIEKGIEPDYLAGHSLGEYSALALAGAIPFVDGLKLVVQRAACMADAGDVAPGTMAAIIGLADDVVADLLEGIDGVVAANFNAPGQVVISGTSDGVSAAMKAMKEAGAKRALPLQVSGAFHSPLMEMAVEGYMASVADAPFTDAAKPVIANVTARPASEASEIRKLLVAQMTSPVRWVESVQHMAALGVDTCYETGSGNVLQGLIRRIDRSLTTIGAGQADQIENL